LEQYSQCWLKCWATVSLHIEKYIGLSGEGSTVAEHVLHTGDPKFDPQHYKKEKGSQVLVAQAYNPTYSRGRDQEDHGLKPA
jgi:hypothetical protein